MSNETKIIFPEALQAALVADVYPTEKPADGMVRGRTLYSLISPGTELSVYRGNYLEMGQAWGKFPFSPGYACTFVVEAVGDGVEGLAVGDTVYGMGLHRSWQELKVEEIIPVPQDLDPAVATFTRLCNVTWSSLTMTSARPPEAVAILGLGPVGLLGALIFQASGYTVIGVDPEPSRRELAESLGVTTVYDALCPGDRVAKHSVPLVLECSGHEKALLDALQVVRFGGEVIQVGAPMRQNTDDSAQEVMHAVFRSRASYRSGTEWIVPRQLTDYRRSSNFANMRGAMAWLQEGRIPTEGLYSIAYPEDPQTHYQSLMNRTSSHPTIVLDWRR